MRLFISGLILSTVVSACGPTNGNTPVPGGAATFDYLADGKFKAKFGSAYSKEEVQNHSAYCKTGKPANLVVNPRSDGGFTVSGNCV